MEDKKEEEIIEEKKKKIISWFSNKNNLLIGLIVFFSFIINLYYFNLTKGQAHWWDSLAYGSLAKESILHLWSTNAFLANEAIIRAPLLPLLWSLLLRINLSDSSIIFILEIIPSIISVYLVYLIGKELYDEKIGLISAFLFSTSWLVIFYTMRIMTDIPTMFLSLLSIYFFIKSYKNFDIKLFSLSILFLSLAVLSRTVSYLLGGVYLLLIIFHNKHHFIKNKNFWIGGIVGVIPLIILFVFNIIKYGSLIPSLSTYASSADEKPGFAYYVIKDFLPGNTDFFPHIFGNFLLVFVIFGLLLVIVELIIGYGFYNKVKKLESNILLLLILISFLAFYIFILRAAEDRYLLVPLIPLLIFASRGIIYSTDFIKKYNMPILVFRLSNIYGPYQDWKTMPNLLPQIISQAFINKKIEVWNFDPIRDYIYVGDVVEAIIKALHSDKTGVFNLGTGVGTCVGEVVTKIANLTDAKVTSLNKPVSGPTRVICNINKIKSKLGWEPSITLDEGIKKTINYYRRTIPYQAT